MSTFINDLWEYLRELLLAGALPVVFFLLDIFGLAIIFIPSLPVDPTIGLGILIIGFFAGNFVLYRKLKPSVTQDSLLIESYHRLPNSGAQIRFVGSEPIKELSIKLSSVDVHGAEQRSEVDQFFSEQDVIMAGHSPHVQSLVPNEIQRFYLPDYDKTRDGKVTIVASFRVVRTGKRFTTKQILDLRKYTNSEKQQSFSIKYR
ncbi:hypothetical protein ANAEL_03562 [Anaerolineales bacterium]|nr:hypothetical protein ANAEL_03562 [Anaerolineales bacterium]